MAEEIQDDSTQASDAENAALMQQIERSIPPMNVADAGRLPVGAGDVADVAHRAVFAELDQTSELLVIEDA